MNWMPFAAARQRLRPLRTALLLFALWLVVLAGCDSATAPTGPQGTAIEIGQRVLLEGDPNWATNSVSWINAGLNGRVPTSEFAFIANSLEAGTNGPSHFLFSAPVNTSCPNADCFPGRGTGFTDASWIIEHLSWSPTGAQVVFQGRPRSTGSRGIFVMPADAESMPPSPLVLGGVQMPSFNRTGTSFVYIDNSKTVVFSAQPQGGGSQLIQFASNLEHPERSPGDSLLAVSARDGVTGTQRIFVWDTRQPDFNPLPVSDPDDTPTRDGRDDNHPTWSPNSTYVAYAATVDAGNQFKPAIHISRVGERTGIGAITRVLNDFNPGDQLSFLQWHPEGELMLFILNNDVWVTRLPARFWDKVPEVEEEG